MNDKDKEAFTKWFCLVWELYPFNFGNLLDGRTKLNSEYSFKFDLQNKTWQAACEYKQKEIENLREQDKIVSKEIKTYIDIANRLQSENSKLKSVCQLAANACCYTQYEDACSLARQVLKEIGEE